MAARKTTFIVISYDIPNNRRRTKVMEALKDFGRHVQESVFECDLKPRDLQRLLGKLQRLIDTEEDNLRLYYLCEACVPRVEVWGVDTVERLRDFYQV